MMINFKIFKNVSPVILSLGFLSACGGSSSGGGGEQSFGVLAKSAQVTSQSLDTNFTNFRTAIVELNSELANCGAFDQTKIESAQLAWIKAMTAWQGLQFMSNGPLSNSGVFVQAWPNEKHLTDSANMELVLTPSADKTFEITRSWLEVSGNQRYRGLQGLEYTLFQKDSGDATLLDSFGNERRCQLINVVSEHLEDWSLDITGEEGNSGNGWYGAPGYRINFTDPGNSSSEYTNAHELQEDWLTDFVFGFETIKNQKLQPAMGWDEGACLTDLPKFSPDSESLEAQYSRQSLNLVFIQIKELKAQFEAYYEPMLRGEITLTGNETAEAPLSIALADSLQSNFAIALAQESVLKDVILVDFINDNLVAMDVANGQPDAQFEAMGKDAEKTIYIALLTLHRELRNITSDMKVSFASLIDVTVSFNATDGDSGRPTSTNCWPN